MYIHVKRLLDAILAALALIVLSPLMLALAFAVKLTSPGPVFFRQKRVGLKKSYFMIYKYRTMRIDAPKDQPTHLLKNPAAFITPIGRFLRKYSLDELPIDVKARLDGEYVRRMNFLFDVKCVVGTVFRVVAAEGVVEGEQKHE